jgi:zinc/manganese transport system substrate-binding protein
MTIFDMPMKTNILEVIAALRKAAENCFVTRIFSLPYRRFAIGTVSAFSQRAELSDTSQNEIPRYSSLKICATIQNSRSAFARSCAALVRPAWYTLVLLLIPASFLASASSAHAKLNVVVTTPDLAAIAKEIGKDQIDITTLAKPTEDPHFVDAKPSFVVKLNRADMLIEGGAELEVGWLPALLEQARNPKLATGAPGHVAAAQGLQLLEVPSTLDRSRGDIHAAGNPHFLVDPQNAKAVAQKIADALCALDQKSSAGYRSNLKTFTDALDVKLAEWQQKLAPFKGQQIVAYHNSWPYFANRFGLVIDLFLEPKPGVPPTPTHLAEVILKMRQDKVHVIIVDPYLNRRTAETIASKTGATVVDVSQFPGGVKGTEGGYIPLMDYLVTSISKTIAQKQ